MGNFFGEEEILLLRPVVVEEMRDHSHLPCPISPPYQKQKKSILLQFPPHRIGLYQRLEGITDFLTRKENLLRKRDLPFKIKERLEFEISTSLSKEQASLLLNQIIYAARIFFLDEVELYFVEDADYGPFSPINELESLSSILFNVRSLMTSDTGTDGKEVLQHMEMLLLDRIKVLVHENEDLYSDHELCEVDSAFEKLENWGRSKNIKTKLMIADGGRGLIASQDIDIGDVVLEIPLSLVIWDESEMPTSLGRTQYVNFTKIVERIMRERSKPNSDYSIFFESLPKEFKTGLSFSEDALHTARGTRLSHQIDSAKGIMRRHFKELSRIDHVQFTKESHKWANELLLSHGVKALMANGTQKPCLTPFAGFFNRSLFPHVLHGELHCDSLIFIASRPCSKGQQCYLTYMNLSGAELATNYGYLPKGKNHNDVIRLDPYLGYERFEETANGNPEWIWYMVRGPSANSGRNCLPKALLGHLRSILCAYWKLEQDMVERTVRNTLREHLTGHLQRLNFLDQPKREKSEEKGQNLNWDVKLALEYKDIEKNIYISAISACNPALVRG